MNTMMYYQPSMKFVKYMKNIRVHRKVYYISFKSTYSYTRWFFKILQLPNTLDFIPMYI